MSILRDQLFKSGLSALLLLCAWSAQAEVLTLEDLKVPEKRAAFMLNLVRRPIVIIGKVSYEKKLPMAAQKSGYLVKDWKSLMEGDYAELDPQVELVCEKPVPEGLYIILARHGNRDRLAGKYLPEMLSAMLVPVKDFDDPCIGKIKALFRRDSWASWAKEEDLQISLSVSGQYFGGERLEWTDTAGRSNDIIAGKSIGIYLTVYNKGEKVLCIPDQALLAPLILVAVSEDGQKFERAINDYKREHLFDRGDRGVNPFGQGVFDPQCLVWFQIPPHGSAQFRINAQPVEFSKAGKYEVFAVLPMREYKQNLLKWYDEQKPFGIHIWAQEKDFGIKLNFCEDLISKSLSIQVKEAPPAPPGEKSKEEETFRGAYHRIYDP